MMGACWLFGWVISLSGHCVLSLWVFSKVFIFTKLITRTFHGH